MTNKGWWWVSVPGPEGSGDSGPWTSVIFNLVFYKGFYFGPPLS